MSLEDIKKRWERLAKLDGFFVGEETAEKICEDIRKLLAVAEAAKRNQADFCIVKHCTCRVCEALAALEKE